jgi:galactitol-specific phosphotransferase system IIC component
LWDIWQQDDFINIILTYENKYAMIHNISSVFCADIEAAKLTGISCVSVNKIGMASPSNAMHFFTNQGAGANLLMDKIIKKVTAFESIQICFNQKMKIFTYFCRKNVVPL